MERVAPAQTVPSAGFLAITGATGSATTIQLTEFMFELQPVPVLFLRLRIILLADVTAAKLGLVVLHALYVPPLSVE